MGTRGEERFQAFLLLPRLCQDCESVLADAAIGDGSVFCAVTQGFPVEPQLLEDKSVLICTFCVSGSCTQQEIETNKAP